jgi:hypothetical protein
MASGLLLYKQLTDDSVEVRRAAGGPSHDAHLLGSRPGRGCAARKPQIDSVVRVSVVRCPCVRGQCVLNAAPRSELGTEKQYALKRLVMGLASSSGSARQGFAAALTKAGGHCVLSGPRSADGAAHVLQLLETDEAVPTQSVLDTLSKHVQLTRTSNRQVGACPARAGGPAGSPGRRCPQEQRDFLFARIFVVLVLCRSGRIQSLPAKTGARASHGSHGLELWLSAGLRAAAVAALASELVSFVADKKLVRELVHQVRIWAARRSASTERPPRPAPSAQTLGALVASCDAATLKDALAEPLKSVFPES